MLLAAVVVSVTDMWRLMLGGSKPVCAAVGISKSCCTFLNSWSTQQYPAGHICLHHTGTKFVWLRSVDAMHQWLRDSKDLLQRHNKASPSEDVRAPSSSSQPSAAASGALARPEHACLPFCSRLLLPINASLCNAALACCLCAVTRLASVRSVLSFMPLPEGPVSVSQRPRRVAACLLLSCTYEVGVCHPAASSL